MSKLARVESESTQNGIVPETYLNGTCSFRTATVACRFPLDVPMIDAAGASAVWRRSRPDKALRAGLPGLDPNPRKAHGQRWQFLVRPHCHDLRDRRSEDVVRSVVSGERCGVSWAKGLRIGHAMLTALIVLTLRMPEGPDSFQRRDERLQVDPPLRPPFWRPTTQHEFDDGN